jgi:hypothetical protein
VGNPEPAQAKKKGSKAKKVSKDGADGEEEDAGAMGSAVDLPPIPAALVGLLLLPFSRFMFT